MPASHQSVFTGWMPFLPSNQQRQSTEGNQSTVVNNSIKALKTTLLNPIQSNQSTVVAV